MIPVPHELYLAHDTHFALSGKSVVELRFELSAPGSQALPITWEYWDGNRWADMLPDDRTFGFTRSGYLKFAGPKNFASRNVFDTEAYWLRARLETGAYDLPPALRASAC